MAVLFALFQLFSSWICYAERAAVPIGLDVNDVSFLLPEKIHDEASGRWSLVNLTDFSPEIFAQILDHLKSEQGGHLPKQLFFESDVIDLKNWKVTSFRYELCGDSFMQNAHRLVQQPGCAVRLRIVAQPRLEIIGIVDTAIHLIYRLNEDTSQDLLRLRDLASSELNVRTTGLPLMVHPAFATALKNRRGSARYLNAAETMLKRWLEQASLQMVTVIAKVPGPGWKFLGGTVTNTTWTPFLTPMQTEFANVVPEELTCNLNLHQCELFPKPFELKSTFREMLVSIGEEQNLKDNLSAEALDNPTTHGLFNTTCVDCHQTKNFRNLDGLVSPLPDALNGLTTFALGRTAMTRSKGRIINFGHDFDGPQVSSRTIAESAKVANDINKKQNLAAPVPYIAPSVYNTIWKCLNEVRPDIEACLRLRALL